MSEHAVLAAQTAARAVLASEAEGVVADELVVGAKAPEAVMRAEVQVVRLVSLLKSSRKDEHEDPIPEGMRET